MSFDNNHYVPCLRWKMGEYQAISRLKKEIKSKITPIIEIPEIGWDFEEKKEKKTIDEHLNDFVLKKIYRKWGPSLCFVDLYLLDKYNKMSNRIHPVNFIFKIPGMHPCCKGFRTNTNGIICLTCFYRHKCIF